MVPIGRNGKLRLKVYIQKENKEFNSIYKIFNLAIFIDEILKYSALRNNFQCNSMYESIRWWVSTHNQWMNESTLQSLIGRNGLKLNDDIPDNVVPILLANTTQPTGDSRKKLHTMLLAYHLRNHGGHNLDQQQVL